jgi:hypothetical protein
MKTDYVVRSIPAPPVGPGAVRVWRRYERKKGAGDVSPAPCRFQIGTRGVYVLDEPTTDLHLGDLSSCSRCWILGGQR